VLEIRAEVAVASTELTDIGVKVCSDNKTGGVWVINHPGGQM